MRSGSLVAFFFVLAAAPVAAADPVVAILSVPGEGLWGPDLERVDRALRAGLEKQKGFAVQPAAATAEHFAEARRMGLGCDLEDVECAVKVGVLADASKVLVVSPSMERGGYAVKLLLADVGTAAVAGRVQWHAPTTGDELEKGLALVVGVLLAPSRHEGELIVDVDRAGATILVDGDERGTSPLSAPIADLSPGAHALAVKLAGHATDERNVLVEPDAPTIVAVRMRTGVASTTARRVDPVPDDPPPPAPATPLSALVIGGGVVAGVGALATAATTIAATAIELRLQQPTPRDERAGLKLLGIGSLVGVGAGVLIGAAGGGLLAFGLMEDDG